MGKGRFLNQKLGKRVSRLAEQRQRKLEADWRSKRLSRGPEPRSLGTGSPRSPKSN